MKEEKFYNRLHVILIFLFLFIFAISTFLYREIVVNQERINNDILELEYKYRTDG